MDIEILQNNPLMKPPTQLNNNSSISRHHRVKWGQSYLPLWYSHAAAKYIPPWKASKVHQKSGIRPSVRSRLHPCLLKSSSLKHTLPLPYNPLLSRLCLGVCPYFFVTAKDFQQHFSQQERISILTDVLQCLMSGANHTPSQMKIWEHSSYPPLPCAAQAGAAPTCTHSCFPHSSTCDKQLCW